jgi:hypothetical protein
MKGWTSFLLTLVLFGIGFAAYILMQGSRPKPKVRPPPRSKSTARSYQESNSLACLFLETLSLKESRATWPAILNELNSEDDPRVRTLLLELRSLSAPNPMEALGVIEWVCIAAKHESERVTKTDLLERAQARLKSAQS